MMKNQPSDTSGPPTEEGASAQDAPDKQEGGKTESLAERSARLEAEAAKLEAQENAQENDPLAPEPLQEEGAQDTNEGGSEKVAALEAALDDAKDKMLRAVAEAENTRRRAQKDREEASKFAISGFARDLLDVADNLRRALEAVPKDLMETEPRLKNLVEGIQATESELLRSFEKNGVKKIDPVDEVFDPNFHEVMMEVTGSGKPPGTIVQVMETGYILNERILRPARVSVAKDEGQGSGGEEPPPPEPGSQIDTEA